MKKVKIGLLGAGICANNFHLPALKRLSDRFVPVAMAGGNPEQNAAYAEKAGISRQYLDYHELIEDSEVEAVISSYPYYLNEELIRAAKRAGKHILVEKPIAESIEKGLRTASLDDGSVVMGVAENWLYWDVIDLIKQELSIGAIGEPVMVQQYSYYDMDLDNQYLRGNAWRRTATGGMILDRTIHAVALMRSIFGPVGRAAGFSGGLRDELGPVDSMTTLLEYKNGIKGSVITSASAPGVTLPFSLAILGKQGTITVSDFMTRVTVTNREGTRVLTADNGDGGYYREFLDFYNAITTGDPFRSSLGDACNDLFAVLTALETPGVWKDCPELKAGKAHTT